MIDNNTKKGTIQNLILTVILTAAFVAGVRLFYVFTYGVIDDPFIETVLSGAYTGTMDAHVVYIKYPLAWILKSLFSLWPKINWHFHLLTGAFGASAFLVTFRICSNVKKVLNKILLSILFLLLFLFCLAKLYTTAHYSMSAGVLTGTGIFYFLTIKDESSLTNRILNYIVCLLLLYLAYCLRARTLFMLLPLAFVAFLYKLFSSKPAFTKQNIVRWILFPVILFVGIGALELSHRAAYRGEEWKTFLSFNDARTTMYDFYGVPPYEGNEVFYEELGISKERLFMYKDRYYLEFTDGMQDGFLNKMAARAVEESYEKVPMGERIMLTLKALWPNLSEKSYQPMSYITAGILLLLLIGALLTKHWRVLVHALLMIPASLIPWIYMIFMGRPVARVASAIWYADLLFVLALLIDQAPFIAGSLEQKMRGNAKGKVIGKVAAAAALMAVLILGIRADYGKIEKQVQGLIASGNVRAQLEEWCEASPDNLYVCESDVITLGFHEKQMDGSLQNLYWPGGWPSKMPQAKTIWNRFGITSIESAILENEHVYLIAFEESDMTYWTDFYQQEGRSVKLNQTETLNFDGIKFAVYQLQGN